MHNSSGEVIEGLEESFFACGNSRKKVKVNI